MNRQLSIVEVLVLLGGVNLVLGVTVFGPRALVFGVALIAMAAAAVAWRIKQTNDAANGKAFSFRRAHAARDSADSAAAQLLLQGQGWQERGTGQLQVYGSDPLDTELYDIECYVSERGQMECTLGSRGQRQEMLFDKIDLGPPTPFGTEMFLRFVKLMGGSATVVNTSPPTLASRPAPSRPVSPAPTRVEESERPAAPPETVALNVFCHSCGQQFKASDVLCADCGARRRARTTPVVSAPEADEAGASSSSEVGSETNADHSSSEAWASEMEPDHRSEVTRGTDGSLTSGDDIPPEPEDNDSELRAIETDDDPTRDTPCPNCALALPPDAHFCSGCGAVSSTRNLAIVPEADAKELDDGRSKTDGALE